MRIPDFPDLPRLPDNVELHINAYKMTGWPNTPTRHRLERATRIASRVINHLPVVREQMVQNATYFVCRNIFISQHIATRKFNLWRADHPSPEFPQDKMLELTAEIFVANRDTIGLAVMPQQPIVNLDPAYYHPKGLLITALTTDPDWMGYQPALSYLKGLQAIVYGSAKDKRVIAILAAPPNAFQNIPPTSPFPGGQPNVVRSLLTWHGAETHWVKDEELYTDCITDEDEDEQDEQNLATDPDFDQNQQPDAAIRRMLADTNTTSQEDGRPNPDHIVTFKEIAKWPCTMSEERTRAALEKIARQADQDTTLIYRSYPDPDLPAELTDTQILRIITENLRLNNDLRQEMYELQDNHEINDHSFHQQVLQLAQRGCSNTTIGIALVREEEVNGSYITFHQVARHPDGMGILPELPQMKRNSAMVYEHLNTGLPEVVVVIPPYINHLPNENHPFPPGPASALADVFRYHGIKPCWIPHDSNPTARPDRQLDPASLPDQQLRAVERDEIGADWPYRPSRDRLYNAVRQASIKPITSHQLDQLVEQPKELKLTDAQQYQELQKQVSDNSRLSRQYAMMVRNRPNPQEHLQIALSLALNGNTNHTMGLAIITPNPAQPGTYLHGFHRITRNRQWFGFNRMFNSIAGCTAIIVGALSLPDPVALMVLPDEAIPTNLTTRPIPGLQPHQDLRLLMEWHRAKPCYIQLQEASMAINTN